jgi:hypothetical protein
VSKNQLTANTQRQERTTTALFSCVIALGLLPIPQLADAVFAQAADSVRAERLCGGPIIAPELHPTIGTNIQGPSLIRVPEWIDDPLGRYYLYFADHKGSYIRLAYADSLCGPWRIHPPGSLQLEDSRFPTEPPEVSAEDEERIRVIAERIRARTGRSTNLHDPREEATTPHIASPDVHVGADGRQILMYFHGLEGVAHQATRVAVSGDGIHFEGLPEVLGRQYFRAFSHGGYTYALAQPGQLYRSLDPLRDFEEGPLLFDPNTRHSAVLKRENTLYVFWTRIGDEPERIYVSTIDLQREWNAWEENGSTELLRPELPWEGSDEPLAPSSPGTAPGRVNELRDPAIYEEDGRVFLLYAVAGESGIAIAQLHFE